MKRVILSAVIAVGTFQLVLATQEADPETENEAPASLEEAVNAAHAEYIANLEAALEQALSEGELDEAIHVRRSISMEQTRAKLTNTSWTWNRPNDPDTIHFRGGRVITTGKGSEGVWEVLEEETIIVKFGETLFMLGFNEAITSYTVKAYNPVRTNYSSGRKTRAG